VSHESIVDGDWLPATGVICVLLTRVGRLRKFG